jgi:hypothetical protein
MQFSEDSGDVEAEWDDGIVVLKIYKAGRGITEKLYFLEDDLDNVIYCLQRIQDIAKNMTGGKYV